MTERRVILGAVVMLLVSSSYRLGSTATPRQVAPPAPAAQGPPPSDAPLPAPLRAHAATYLDSNAPEPQRLGALDELIDDDSPAAQEFLLRALDWEGSPEIRLVLIAALENLFDSRLRDRLQRIAAADPSAEVRTLALRRLTAARAEDLRQGLIAQRELARAMGDATLFAQLDEQATRLTPLSAGSVLARDLTKPCEPFVLSVAGPTVRFAAIGDFGSEGSGATAPQERVARALRAYHNRDGGQRRLNFGLTLGDNFYPSGLEFDPAKPNDPRYARWKTDWEDVYKDLDIAFYPVLGNHDWIRGSDGELLYTSPTWKMCGHFYTFTAGPVRFYAIDTEDMWEGKKAHVKSWLTEELKRERDTTWRIVYGHHVVLSGGSKHGDDEETDVLRRELLPIFAQGGVDLYVAGHDHDMQFLRTGGQHLVVNGASGKDRGGRTVSKLPQTLFCGQVYGFTAFEADSSSLRTTFVTEDSKEAYSCTFTRKPGANAAIGKCPEQPKCIG